MAVGRIGMLIVCFVAFPPVVQAHQGPDHSDLGVDVTIESATLLDNGRVRAMGQYTCLPKAEKMFGPWGVSFKVYEDETRENGFAGRGVPLTHAPCTGDWEAWSLLSNRVKNGGVVTEGMKVGKTKMQDALEPGDERTHKHLGGSVMIPVRR